MTLQNATKLAFYSLQFLILLATQATVSGGSWFSTQLFYSQAFYTQTVLAESPQDLEEFVLRWMATYYNISTDIVSKGRVIRLF